MQVSKLVILINMTQAEEIYTPPTNTEPPLIPEAPRQSWNGWWTLLWAAAVMIAWLVLQGIVITVAYFMQGTS